jgi:alkanesulfonate monooxygenase SsuD/methylene tetrahydromethanopterin reductase-like flavin-dependent oxidoreductase (luciferase family)
MEISVAVAARPKVPPEDELRTAVLADRLGYGELWIGDVWVWDCFVLATAIGSATKEIALTVGPLPVQVRDPATIARAAASTAARVRRPVGVALGTSSVRVVERMHGRSRRRAATALAESAQAVRAFLREGQADFDGEVVSAHYRLRLDPPGGPLTVAAFGDRGHCGRRGTRRPHGARPRLTPARPRVSRQADHAGQACEPPGAQAGCLGPGRVDPGPEAHAQIMRSLVGTSRWPDTTRCSRRRVRQGCGDDARGRQPRRAAERTPA